MTSHAGYQHAQLNIAAARYDMDDPRMRDFTDALLEVNAIADGSPGFVWRLQSDEGDATSFRFGDDPRTLVNLSVWESLTALQRFYLGDEHGPFLQRRAEWFERATQPYAVLWWVAEGHQPSLDEARERLDMLRAAGPAATAFDFAHPFEAPGTGRTAEPTR